MPEPDDPIGSSSPADGEARRADPFASSGSIFVAGFAHEVRGSIHAISALVAALELADDPENRAILTSLRCQVDRLSKLVQDLLAIGRPIRASAIEPLDPASLCRDILDHWRAPDALGIRIVRLSDTGDRSIRIAGDSSKLREVLTNLLDNASHFSPPEEPIRIEIRRAPDRVAIAVVDQGAGVPPDRVEKLFEPFFTLRKEGTGLGLSVVRQIATAHGGSVSLRNNVPPPGCTAEISLPALGAEAKEE
jgi:signal transduction histidine kinase